MARLLLPVILLQFTMISLRQSAETPNTNTTDLTALIDFKNRITDDPLRVMASWNDSTHYCNWKGITCDPSNQRVEILNLMSQQLVGSLPPSLSNLTFLRGINLRFNSFHGGIPPQLGLLSNLKHLNLTNNILSGSIPSALGNCTELTVFTLAYNQLSGKIPNQLSSLRNLEIFGVGSNNITDTFPVWIGNLSSRFSSFSLAVNSFHGGIPPEIGRLSGLTYFQVYGNQFSGELPTSIYNMSTSTLTFFSVTQNRLQGSIRQDVGLKFPFIEFFAAGVNNFTGEIPISLANSSRIQLIELSENSLTGTVPSVLGRLPFLYWLNLEQNLLGNGESKDMSFVSSLTNCTDLRVLALLANKFDGELPNAVANLSRKLEMFTVGDNRLHGSLPSGIGSFQNLTYLSLEDNLFTGSIPSDLGKLGKLNRLDMFGNKLTGVIPSSLGNLTSLIQLNLNSNKLQGNIPSHLGNCTSLLQLNLSGNNLTGSLPPHLGNCISLLQLNLSGNSLTGSLPPEIMSLSSLSIFLDLSRNSFTGSLPVEVGSLVNLKQLEVSGNRLSGEIPSSLSKCLSLEILIMGGNRFEGEIPNSLEALRGLEEIDFSHNELSGKIPDFLGELPFLDRLDLSYNDLEGEVLSSGIFSNATAFVSVVGNNKLCGGVLRLNLLACPVPAKESDKNPKLSRWVIPLTVSLTLAIVLICSLGVWCILRRPKEIYVTALSTNEMRGVSYQELYRSTDGFSSNNLIGLGSFGSVYKGILGEESMPVAIKVLNLDQKGASKSFLDECAILKSIRHRNLLKIIAVCSSFDNLGQEFKCLVMELMVNGSLDAWLHPSKDSRSSVATNTFGIMERFSVATDVAAALNYLHNHSHTPIIHCDLKPSNVLLDEDFTARVADFGLSKFLFEDPNAPLPYHSSSFQLKGSIGYIPPEYGTSTRISAMGDVYSFGVLLLELFTGKRPTDDMFKTGLSIREHVTMALPEHVTDVLDPALILPKEEGREMHEIGSGYIKEEYLECLVSVLKIGLSCSETAPKDRTPIGDVVNQLHSIRERIRRAT